MEQQEERRRAVRYAMAVPIDVDGETCTTCNVSTTAVSFHARRGFDVGRILDFTIHVPDRESNFRMECQGQVVRCEADGDRFLTSATIDIIRIGRLVIGAP